MHRTLTTAALLAALAWTQTAGASDPNMDAFTYQAELRLNGQPVLGPVNLSFRLYDAASDGQTVGPQLNAFGYEDFDDAGRFTMDLDFGKNVFDGSPLWLEISVDGVPLEPRQKIMPTPYAVRALDVAGVSSDALSGQYANELNLSNPANQFAGSGANLTSLNASNLSSGTIGSSLLSGTYSNAVTFSNASGGFSGTFDGTHSGNGSGLTNLNASNISVGNLSMARMPAGGNWSLSSSLNIGTGVMFLNNTNGRVGIGTNAPNSRLHVNSIADEIAFRAQIAGLTKLLVAPSGGVSIGVNNTNPPEDGLYVLGSTGIGSLPETNSKLDVLMSANTNLSRGLRVRHTGNALETTAARFEGSGNATARGIEAQGRARGIVATATESGAYAGHFLAPNGTNGGAAVRGENSASGGLAYGGYFRASSNTGAGGIGVLGFADANTGTNYGVYGQTNSNNGYAGYFFGGRNYFQGNVSIGNLNPGDKLHINADETENALRVVVAGTTRFRLYSSGGVGIGSNMLSSPPIGGDLSVANAVAINVSGNNPAPWRLAVNGNAAKPGGGSWSLFSDKRLKRDIRPVGPGTLDRLLTLNAYTFEYDESIVGDRLVLPGRQLGLIAQEVAGVFPDWVEADHEGYLHVTERAVTAIMTEAFRELRAEKDAQLAERDAEIKELRAEIDDLRALVLDLLTLAGE